MAEEAAAASEKVVEAVQEAINGTAKVLFLDWIVN